MTHPELLEQLAAHQTLGPAPRGELEWLAAHGSARFFAPGTVLTRKGGPPPEGMYILLSGHVVIHVDRGSGPKKVMEWRAGDVTGLLPFSRMTSPPGDTVIVEPTEVLLVPAAAMHDMIRECYEVTAILVHKMLDRARQFASSDLHDEKMVSLGKLSAGLAHELNNPAAAIERSATLLDDRLDEAERATLALGAARLSDVQLEAVEQVRKACLASPVRGVLSPLQQAAREDAISDWLHAHAIDTAIAAQLADTAVTVEALDTIAEAVGRSCLDAVLRWAAAGCSVRALASEIQDAATRISGIVAAVKGFTHMDQGRSTEVDLVSALNNTVTVLRSKARARKVSVTVNVEPDVPHVCGFVGELNQIFANLIDNALDAVPESGRVEVRVHRERNAVVVHIVDNGPGIPPEIRERIFEPFFTTKPVGKGTGLGLDIVHRLLGHNDAQIEVESRPGHTEFIVMLPAVGSAEHKGMAS